MTSCCFSLSPIFLRVQGTKPIILTTPPQRMGVGGEIKIATEQTSTFEAHIENQEVFSGITVAPLEKDIILNMHTP